MVNDKHIGVGLDGGINDGVSGFQGANDPLDGVVGISAYQTGESHDSARDGGYH